MTYRSDWYRERGLPYEPPKLTPCPPFRCLGGIEKLKLPVRPMREPGADEKYYWADRDLPKDDEVAV